MCTTLPPHPDLHHRDPGDAAGPWASEAAELRHAHWGAVPSQHGDAWGAGGWRRLWGDPWRHPRRVLQVRQRPLHWDPPTSRRCGSSRLWKGEPGVCTCLDSKHRLLNYISSTKPAHKFLLVSFWSGKPSNPSPTGLLLVFAFWLSNWKTWWKMILKFWWIRHQKQFLNKSLKSISNHRLWWFVSW